MNYRISQGVSFCTLDGGTVVLDERQDRYFLLRSTAAQALQSLSDGMDITDNDAKRLLELRIIAEGAIGHALNKPIALRPANASAMDLPHRPAQSSVGAGFEIAVALSSAFASLRFRRLDRVLHGLGRAAPPQVAPAGDVIALAQLFERIRSQLPLKRTCLLDSIALIRFLDGRGHSADLVMGVALNPFAAHCWAQAGDVILNESLDCAATFAPIRVA